MDQQSLHSEPEESFSKDLPEFPSVEEFPCGEPLPFPFPLGSQEEEEPQSPASLLLQHLASPLHFVNTHFNGQATGGAEQAAPRSLETLSEHIVSTAISAVVHNTLTALLSSPGEPDDEADFLPSETADRTSEDLTLMPPEDEEFELLDQSELEHMDEGLSLESEGQDVARATPTHAPPSERRREES